MIGNRIATLRKSKGLSQKELASIINVTPSAVSQWEHNKTQPDTMILVSLSSALGVTLSELMGEIPKPENPIAAEAEALFKRLTEAEQNEVLEFLRFKANKNSR